MRILESHIGRFHHWIAFIERLRRRVLYRLSPSPAGAWSWSLRSRLVSGHSGVLTLFLSTLLLFLLLYFLSASLSGDDESHHHHHHWDNGELKTILQNTPETKLTPQETNHLERIFHKYVLCIHSSSTVVCTWNLFIYFSL